MVTGPWGVEVGVSLGSSSPVSSSLTPFSAENLELHYISITNIKHVSSEMCVCVCACVCVCVVLHVIFSWLQGNYNI